MSRDTLTRSVTVVLAAAAVFVAGCSAKKATNESAASASAGASSGSASAAASSPSAHASVQGDPAAVALFSQAMAGLGKVSSVRLKGAITSSGQGTSVDVAFTGNGATGSIGIGGGTVKILAVDQSVYIQADAKAFAGFGASAASDPAAVSAIVGKWLKVSGPDTKAADNPFGDFASFTNLKSFADQFTPSGKISIIPGKKTINGKSAIGLLDSGGSDGEPSVLYVEDGDGHLPLEVVPGPAASSAPSSGGPTSGHIDFVDYNAPVTLVAPVGAIDIGQLAQLFGAPGAASSS